jgi:hypothetical protein
MGCLSRVQTCTSSIATPPNFYSSEFDIPSTDDITPRHGFASGLFGRRTRSLGSGGSGRWVADWTAVPCGFGTILECASIVWYGFD